MLLGPVACAAWAAQRIFDNVVENLLGPVQTSVEGGAVVN